MDNGAEIHGRLIRGDETEYFQGCRCSHQCQAGRNAGICLRTYRQYETDVFSPLNSLIYRWRERALAVTADQVQEAAQKYLVEPALKGLTSEAVLGEITEPILQSLKWEKFDFDLSIRDEAEEAAEAVAA